MEAFTAVLPSTLLSMWPACRPFDPPNVPEEGIALMFRKDRLERQASKVGGQAKRFGFRSGLCCAKGQRLPLMRRKEKKKQQKNSCPKKVKLLVLLNDCA